MLCDFPARLKGQVLDAGRDSQQDRTSLADVLNWKQVTFLNRKAVVVA
jgi:hypothetical protein